MSCTYVFLNTLCVHIVCMYFLRPVASKGSGCSTNKCNCSLESVRVSSLIGAQSAGMTVLCRGSRGMAKKLSDMEWDTIVCEGVPVSLRELVTTVVYNLDLPVSVRSCEKLLKCSWNLGWHVSSTTTCGKTRNFLGGGAVRNVSSPYLRGDWVETRITDMVGELRTSRLCRIICTIRIKNLRKITKLRFPVVCDDDSQVTWQTEKNKEDDIMIFLLVRYAKPHQHTRRRGPEHRPLCPGILQDTHCLWEWAKKNRTYRRGCLTGRAWESNKQFFGDSHEIQIRRRNSERYAWYDLIQVSDITSHTNVQLDPDREDSYLQSVMWW